MFLQTYKMVTSFGILISREQCIEAGGSKLQGVDEIYPTMLIQSHRNVFRVCLVIVSVMVLTRHSPATEIVAHRGASHDCPENTVAAATQAWREGASAVELDIHLTKDKKLVVIHDSTTQRTSGVEGVIGKMNVVEIQKLDVGEWKDKRFSGERISTLDEFLAVGPSNRRFFIEIKGGPEIVPELKACITRANLESEDAVVIISFNMDALASAKREMPRFRALLLLPFVEDSDKKSLVKFIKDAKKQKIDGLDIARDWPIDEALVSMVHKEDLDFYVWTVDDISSANRFIKMGVDGITTNRPGFLLNKRGRQTRPHSRIESHNQKL